jgi:hypothetical protein
MPAPRKRKPNAVLKKKQAGLFHPPIAPQDILTIADVLKAAEPRPQPAAEQGKGTYAVRFANAMAQCIANRLRPDFPGILPNEHGEGTESPATGVRGPKKLDVNYSTPQLGLALGISLKSVHFRDKGEGRYTHNTKRNDEELRVESSGYHARQPYSVMVAVLVLPEDACSDGKRDPSSFGAWVKYLRPLAGRDDPGDDIMLFERVFICLYDPLGSRMGFFDVQDAPPKHGSPDRLLSFEDFLAEIKGTYERRNHLEFEWDNGEEDPNTEAT